MLFTKYASPYSLLDDFVSLERLTEFVYSIVEADNERKMWEIYLACVANPYSEVTSFDEFKRKHTAPKINENINLEATINDSYGMLKEFKPES